MDMLNDIKQWLLKNGYSGEWLECLMEDLSTSLISRTIIMEYLREKQAECIIKRHEEENAEYCSFLNGRDSAINEFIEFIVQCPPSYQIDPVIEQIKQIIRSNKSIDSEMD